MNFILSTLNYILFIILKCQLYENVHGGWGFGERDKEGLSILDFAETHELSISNTWFRRDENRLIT